MRWMEVSLLFILVTRPNVYHSVFGRVWNLSLCTLGSSFESAICFVVESGMVISVIVLLMMKKISQLHYFSVISQSHTIFLAFLHTYPDFKIIVLSK